MDLLLIELRNWLQPLHHPCAWALGLQPQLPSQSLTVPRSRLQSVCLLARFIDRRHSVILISHSEATFPTIRPSRRLGWSGDYTFDSSHPQSKNSCARSLRRQGNRSELG